LDIAVFTVAYDGYGPFMARWLRAVTNLSEPASQVLVVLGPDHGWGRRVPGEIRDRVNIIETEERLTNGAYRNLAAREIDAEWTVLVDADDRILPGAVGAFRRASEDGADVVVPTYYSKSRRGVRVATPRLPDVGALRRGLWQNRGFFLTASYAYRTDFLGPDPYADHRHPNIIHAVRLALAGARFSATSEPCFVYHRRPGSMSGSRTSRQRQRIYADLNRHVKGMIG
jgi:hypothetical protein